MKKFIHNKLCMAAMALLFAALTSCESEGDSIGISTLTKFPTFEFPNGTTSVITTGTTFTPSVVVKEGDKELTPVISTSLNVNVPGIYNVGYTAINSDGYPGTASQQVIVYNPAIIPTDVRGNIVDANNAARKGTITLVPGTTNLFLGSDMAFGGVFPLYFQMDGNTMTVIPQSFVFGVTSVDATYNPVTKRFTVLVHPQEFAYTFKYE
jgi:hypothetical protein